ncbi:MAG: hypothetical protein B7Y88_00975 [Sphingomonadales bacterium 32-64-17]|nr:MAG: hypothetical protein B7Y88_00975 [Sphingomonadales bacterium 32-64-17]
MRAGCLPACIAFIPATILGVYLQLVISILWQGGTVFEAFVMPIWLVIVSPLIFMMTEASSTEVMEMLLPLIAIGMAFAAVASGLIAWIATRSERNRSSRTQ